MSNTRPSYPDNGQSELDQLRLIAAAFASINDSCFTDFTCRFCKSAAGHTELCPWTWAQRYAEKPRD